MENLIMSTVKRDQLKKKQKLEQKAKMRESLPVLNSDEIRRYRLPYNEALLRELEEKGFPSSARFINQLLVYHDHLCQEHGPDSIVSSRPKLRNIKKHMDRLYRGFQRAEAAHYDDKIKGECDELLELGVFFGLGNDDWWWLGEQILIQCVNVSSNYHGDGGEREAISRFVFGKFLLENLKDFDRAIEQLKQARTLAVGNNWTTYRIFHGKQCTVFMQSCGLLNLCYQQYASLLMQDDPVAAAKLCVSAIKMAQEACEFEQAAASYMLKGRCDMNSNNARGAISSFQKSLGIFTRKNRTNDVCEARIQLALALLAVGNFNDSAYHLKQLLDYATEKSLPHYMGKAYRYLGEYYLNHGSPNIATPILLLALKMFHELNDIFNREQVKNLAAISEGQENLPVYIKMILDTSKQNKTGAKNIIKLINWKDHRERFWKEQSGENHSQMSVSIQSLKSMLTNSLSTTSLQSPHLSKLSKELFRLDELEDEPEEKSDSTNSLNEVEEDRSNKE